MRWRLLAVMAVGLPAVARADLFSPGELSRPHASLEGMSNCTQCHPAGEQLSQAQCLSCHTELKPGITAGKGFHGHIAEANRACESCHHEHQGREFEMIEWGAGGMARFDHGKTGWPLLGKHAPVKCAECHQTRRIANASVLALLQKQPRRKTMLGLTTGCASCHFDEHRGQLEGTCQSCHTEVAWKKAPNFNHAKTAFPLLGKHKAVACQKCHGTEKDDQTPKDTFPAPVSATFVRLAPVDHQGCQACHTDPHKGTLGPRCESCHTVNGWMLISRGGNDRAFHEKTRYPLRGEHMVVACQSCHGPFPGQRAVFKGLKFAACTDCHVDAHEGQLSRNAPRGAPPACESCHAVEGFKPARFEAADHAKTRFPLEGAHQVVACSGCHPSDPRLAAKVPATVRSFLAKRKRQDLFSLAAFEVSKPTDRCESCHADPHGGQFKSENKPAGCASCHQVASWQSLRFDHAKDSRFPLTGKHATTPCASCHVAEVQRGGVKQVRYRPLETSCASCHNDVHVGQFAAKVGAPTACERCHVTDTFAQVAFTHAPPFTAFLLEGQHAKVPCQNCHRKVEIAPGVSAVRYKPLPQACEGCHSDFHKGAFKGFEP